MNTQRLPNIKHIFSESLIFLKNHIKNLFVILVLPLLLNILVLVGLPYIEVFLKGSHIFIRLIYNIGIVGINFILPLFSLYIFSVAFRYIINGTKEKGSIKKAYFEVLSLIISVIWVTILYSLVIFGTSVIFIIPGIITINFICFSLIVVIDSKSKGIDALSYSTFLVRGYWWPVFWRLVVIGIFNLIISALIILTVFAISALITGIWDPINSIKSADELYVLSVGISYFVTSILALPYFYFLYVGLKKIKGELTLGSIKKIRPLYIGLCIWGLVIGFILSFIITAFIFIDAFKYANKSIPRVSSSQSIMGTSMVKYVDPQGKFEIMKPDTWEVFVENNCTFIIAPIRSYDSLSRGSVMVCDYSVYPNTTLEGLVSSVEREYKNNPEDVSNERQIVSKEYSYLSGFPAITFFTSKKRTLDGGTTYFTQISEETHTFKGERGFNVTYKNNIIEYESLRAKGVEIIKTFKIL